MGFFRYGPAEVEHLRRQDKELGLAIDRIGMIDRAVIPDLFTALMRSLVSQQISSKAAATVWKRLMERFPSLTPDILARVPVEEIQRCGLSMRKAGNIQNIAGQIVRGELDLSALQSLPDEDVIQRLRELPGVGVWTAEMLMIFSLQRPDVVSWGDLAIRRGMMRLYGLSILDRAAFDGYRRRYSPFGSVASLYLWHIAVEDWQSH